MEWTIVLYVVGFFVTYVWLKVYRNNNDLNGWFSVIATFLVSLLSWIGFAVFLLTLLLDAIDDYFDQNPPPKPPKWL